MRRLEEFVRPVWKNLRVRENATVTKSKKISHLNKALVLE